MLIFKLTRKKQGVGLSKKKNGLFSSLLLLSHFSRVRLCATPVPGILQARTLERVAISFSNA